MEKRIWIRLSNAGDIDRIMAVYESAKKFMRSRGNMTQWTGGYPSRELILSDIAHGSHFIGFDKEGEIMMVFGTHTIPCVSFGGLYGLLAKDF